MIVVLVYAVEILIAILLKTTVLTHFAFGYYNIIPDLIIMIVVAAAYQRGKTKGMFVGFCAGLVLDIASGGLLGVFALFYMFIGYLNGTFAKYYVQNDILLPLVLAASSEFIYSFMFYVFLFLTKGRTHVGAYILYQMIPLAIYTAVVFLPVYRILDLIYWKVTKPLYTDYSKVET
ncbi:MAG: rod shape-determining protein MreD [Lachnospiraceae bacterium]|nr:rod shape-determining protein MreD [Lachnospiraceae bacterium]